MSRPDRCVVSVESILVDLTLAVPRLPERGGDVLASAPVVAVGGGFNLLVAVARQGVAAVYAGIRGTGPYGDLVVRALDELGVSTAIEPDPRGDTGLCLTFLDPDAERTFVTSPGVESRITLDQLRTTEVLPGDVVAVSGYDLVYEEAADPVLAWLAELPEDVTVVLDPGPLVADIRPDRWQAAMGRVDVLSLNEREAALAGDVPADVLLVVRRGAAGCTVEGGPDRLARVVVPAPVVAAVDTTGAGDTHTGVLAAGLVEGRPLLEALRRATVAAALSVTRPGPSSAPTAAELDEALAESDGA